MLPRILASRYTQHALLSAPQRKVGVHYWTRSACCALPEWRQQHKCYYYSSSSYGQQHHSLQGPSSLFLLKQVKRSFASAADPPSRGVSGGGRPGGGGGKGGGSFMPPWIPINPDIIWNRYVGASVHAYVGILYPSFFFLPTCTWKMMDCLIVMTIMVMMTMIVWMGNP